MNPTRLGIASFLSLAASIFPAHAQFHAARRIRPVLPDAYAVDFVSTAALGIDMNVLGDVVGTSRPDLGCGSFCLPPEETVVWRGGDRIVLPGISGLSGITVRAIDRQGRVVGFAGFPYTATHAVVWIPSGAAYTAIDLGTLPGTNASEAIGIDDQGRVVGWSTTTSFPPVASPFLWTLAGGMVDLSALGFPNEKPLAVSPGGTVATTSRWYRLGDPQSVVDLTPPPPGFDLNAGSVAVNDAGDQGRFLVRVSGQNLVYLYRYHHEGVWQPISPNGTGHLSAYGMGSIDAERTITATVQGAGVLALGPDGAAASLQTLVSSAYPGAVVTGGGARAASGAILSRLVVGQSQRVVRLTPTWSCVGACMRVSNLTVGAVFVPDPNDPTRDHCSPDLTAHNVAMATVEVHDSAGSPVAGALVSGRFLDDYWTDDPVTQTTGADGVVTFRTTGPCGVGAIAFLVDDVTKPGLVLDRTTGVLSAFAIPQ